MTKILLICGAFCLYAIRVHGDENTLHGVWRGTLGKQEIVACFNKGETDSVTGNGSYYYLRYASPIRLEKKIHEPQWEEWNQTVTGVWTLLSVENDQLSAQWQRPGEIDTLPIRLQRVKQPAPANPSDETDPENRRGCGSDVYVAPLEQQIKIVAGKPETYAGTAYRHLNVSFANTNVDTIEILHQTPGAAAVNELLYQQFNGDVGELKECNRIHLEMSATGGGASIEITLEFAGSHFISIKRNWDNGGCGPGSHKGSWDYYTYNLATGTGEDFDHWFIGGPNKYYEDEDQSEIATAMRALQEDIVSECKRAWSKEHIIEGENCEPRQYYIIRLRPKGMLFTESGMNGVDMEIPYQKLMPYLSQEGKAEVALLMQDRKKRK